MKQAAMVVCVLAIAALVAVIAGGRAGSQAVAQGQPTDGSRYSTQAVMVPPLELTLWITDHRDQKLYMYHAVKESLQLSATVDLSKAGNAQIELVEAQQPS